MKMHATFGAKYYTGNALPSGDVCVRVVVETRKVCCGWTAG